MGSWLLLSKHNSSFFFLLLFSLLSYHENTCVLLDWGKKAPYVQVVELIFAFQVQQQLQMRIEAQGKYLQKIIEEQQKLAGTLETSERSISAQIEQKQNLDSTPEASAGPLTPQKKQRLDDWPTVTDCSHPFLCFSQNLVWKNAFINHRSSCGPKLASMSCVYVVRSMCIF